MKFLKTGNYFINNTKLSIIMINIVEIEWLVIAEHTVKVYNIKPVEIIFIIFCMFKVIRGINILEFVQLIRE